MLFEFKQLLIYSLSVYLIGLFGLVTYMRTPFFFIIAFELVILGQLLFLVTTTSLLPHVFGQVVSLLLLVLAGSEAGLGLALLVSIFYIKSSVDLDQLSSLKS